MILVMKDLSGAVLILANPVVHCGDPPQVPGLSPPVWGRRSSESSRSLNDVKARQGWYEPGDPVQHPLVERRTSPQSRWMVTTLRPVVLRGVSVTADWSGSGWSVSDWRTSDVSQRYYREGVVCQEEYDRQDGETLHVVWDEAE